MGKTFRLAYHAADMKNNYGTIASYDTLTSYINALKKIFVV